MSVAAVFEYSSNFYLLLSSVSLSKYSFREELIKILFVPSFTYFSFLSYLSFFFFFTFRAFLHKRNREIYRKGMIKNVLRSLFWRKFSVGLENSQKVMRYG